MANYIRQYVLIYYDTVIYNSINNEPMSPVSFIATEPSWKLDVLAGLLSLTLCNPRLLCPRNSPDKNTGLGRHSLLQEIFSTQRSNAGVLHCRQILYHLNHQGGLINIYNNINIQTYVVSPCNTFTYAVVGD